MACRLRRSPPDPDTSHHTTILKKQLTDRAFQLTVGYQRLPKFEAAFDAPFVNWTRHPDPKELTEHLYAAHRVSERAHRGTYIHTCVACMVVAAFTWPTDPVRVK